MKGVSLKIVIVSLIAASVTGLNPGWAQPQDKKLEPFELDGTTWDIELTYFDAKNREKTENDTLKFADHKIISRGYKKKGYEPTNYSVKAVDESVTTFETMQIYNKETSFWKGGISEDKTLQGSLHVQDSEGNTKEYYLRGKLVSGTLRRKGEQALEPPPPPAPEAAPAQESLPASPAGKSQ